MNDDCRFVKREEVKKCAKCMGQPSVLFNGYEWLICCKNCGQSVHSDSREVVLASWNKRNTYEMIHPCNFCGSEAKVYGTTMKWTVKCTKCRTETSCCTKDSVICLWNKENPLMIQSDRENEIPNDCAKCGGKTGLFSVCFGNYTEYYVKCLSCEKEDEDTFPSKSEAVEHWNHRNPKEGILPEIRQCPFCGEVPGVVYCEYPRLLRPKMNKPFYVQCSCGVTMGYDFYYGGTFDTKKEAIETWNRRAGE